jgi:hypothetical protein
MTEAAVVTGWRVYRARRTEFLDPARVRRRTRVAGAVASVAATVLIVSDAALRWTGLPFWSTDVVAVFVGVTVGGFVAVFSRVGSVTPSERFAVTGDWRREERIGLQFGARPPTILPEDRDAVLARAERTTEATVVMVERMCWSPVALAAMWCALLVVGTVTSVSLVVVLLPPVYVALNSGTAVSGLLALGRADAARRRAEATPPYDPPPAAPSRNRDPRGSKLGLPDT